MCLSMYTLPPSRMNCVAKLWRSVWGVAVARNLARVAYRLNDLQSELGRSGLSV
jgi:hypothetical protein